VTTLPASNPSDWRWLDLLKCLGVIGMILSHAVYFTWTYSGQLAIGEDHRLYSLFQSMMFLGWFPLMLPFIAGAAFYMRLAPNLAEGTRILTPTLLIQCAIVALVGYGMNVLAAGWYALHSWNVLQTVAVSMLVIALLAESRFGVWAVAIVGGLLLVVSDPLRQWWPPESRPDVVRILLGDPDDWHTWPLVPWFTLVAFGFALAHWHRIARSSGSFVGFSILVGIGLVIAAAFSDRLVPVLDEANMIGPAVMQPPTIAVLGLIGVALLLSALLTAGQDHFRITRYGLVQCYSAGIFWIYLVHLVIGMRLSNTIFSGSFQREAVLATPLQPTHLTVLIGIPLLLLLISWLVGYLTLMISHEKRFRLHLRRVTQAHQAV